MYANSDKISLKIYELLPLEQNVFTVNLKHRGCVLKAIELRPLKNNTPSYTESRIIQRRNIATTSSFVAVGSPKFENWNF